MLRIISMKTGEGIALSGGANILTASVTLAADESVLLSAVLYAQNETNAEGTISLELQVDGAPILDLDSLFSVGANPGVDPRDYQSCGSLTGTDSPAPGPHTYRLRAGSTVVAIAFRAQLIVQVIRTSLLEVQ